MKLALRLAFASVLLGLSTAALAKPVNICSPSNAGCIGIIAD
ncbi:hypothetical protein [Deinococcus aquatilis]|nr:hypothetical protein [Deinococcus aquatilis]